MSENHAPPSGPNDRPQPAQPATKHDAEFMRRLYATLLFEHECIRGEFPDLDSDQAKQDPQPPKGNQP